jgi:Domain of unknown function (DUF4431)
LAGTLILKDEAGYNQFIALRLPRAICTMPDPYHGAIREIQAGVYGSDAHSEDLRDRLDRLVGYRVTIKGVLFAAHTGYHRTKVQHGVESVDAADAAGKRALRIPKPEFRARNVAVYDVTINAGRRLAIEAHQTGSGKALRPADKYLSHWMTGGEVLYVDCLDGFERSLISSTDKDMFCFDGDLCGIQAFTTKPVIIKIRCTKKP